MCLAVGWLDDIVFPSLIPGEPPCFLSPTLFYILINSVWSSSFSQLSWTLAIFCFACFAFVLWIAVLLTSVRWLSFIPNWHWTYCVRWVERDLPRKKDADKILDTVRASVLQSVWGSKIIFELQQSHMEVPCAWHCAEYPVHLSPSILPTLAWDMSAISFNRTGKRSLWWFTESLQPEL